jgi:exoribonuclease R
MLPEKLSTNLTSLNFNEDRLSIVVEMVIGADGSLQDSDIYRARVRNHAKLAYNSVAAWLEGSGVVLGAMAAANGLDENLLGHPQLRSIQIRQDADRLADHIGAAARMRAMFSVGRAGRGGSS